MASKRAYGQVRRLQPATPWIALGRLLDLEVMLDARPILDDSPQLQRSRGAASVALGLRDGATHLARLSQKGCAKAILPRSDSPDPEVVFLNTAGGLTGGDHLSFELDLAQGTKATAATQTAERAYASIGGVAKLDVTLKVGAGAALDWLPQETILFDHSALDRRTTVHLGEGARLLMVETVVLGRRAMGETIATLDFRDRRLVLDAEGAPIFAEPLAITQDTLNRRATPAGLAGARAFSTIVMIAPDAEDNLDALRRLLADRPNAGATAWDGRLVVRAMADDAFPLRQLTAQVLTHLRGQALPRVWQL